MMGSDTSCACLKRYLPLNKILYILQHFFDA